MKTINSERDSIDTALAVAPVAIGNLTLAYNPESGTIGSRIGIQGQLWDADGFLCAIVQQSQHAEGEQGPRLHDLRAAARAGRGQHPGRSRPASSPGSRPARSTTQPTPAQPTAAQTPAAETQARYSSDDTPTMTELLGGGS